MTLTITICCDNAAFEGENCGSEIARVLRVTADTLESCSEEGVRGCIHCGLLTPIDLNGNTVGTVTVRD